MTTAVGVDGCKAGWIAAWRDETAVFARFADLLAAFPADACIAVDMPIGLPERIVGPGRVAEQAVRGLLKKTSSSVFSMPARAAVEADPGPHFGEAERGEAHRRTSALARTLSEPARGVSRQGFMLFPKILEIDGLLRATPGLAERVVESHPEIAFAVLNGGRSLAAGKKLRGVVHPAGMAERRTLLLSAGLPEALLDRPAPRGAARDDHLDACAMLVVAERYASGAARPYPDPPGRDAHGLPVAIWA